MSDTPQNTEDTHSVPAESVNKNDVPLTTNVVITRKEQSEVEITGDISIEAIAA